MFALIDCNNFFVSCERVFQPHLQGKPTLVMSSNDGCVIARSQETKDLGIPMGIPIFKIKDIIKQHDIQLRSTNFRLYRDISARVMETIKSISGRIEVYSIDECFIEIPKDESPYFFCKRIRDKVLLQTGIPVSIGVAPTKTLAKLANKKAKASKTSNVYMFDLSNKKKFNRVLKQTSVGEIWGIGRSFSEELISKKIFDVHQFISLPDGMVRSLFGVVGQRKLYELRGISAYPFEDVSEPKKGIISSRSFSKKVFDKEELWDSISHHVDHIARELRYSHQTTKCIGVRIYTNRFGADKHSSQRDSRILTRSTNSTKELLSVARSILDDIFMENIPYSKSGVQASILSSDEFISTASLFDDAEKKPNASIDSVIDTLEKKHGNGSVVLGALFSPTQKHEWMPNSNMRSPEYTTSWNDILVISKKVY